MVKEPTSTDCYKWPLVLRLTGLWLIWGTWATADGWILSALGSLHGKGYLLTLPFLIGGGTLWWLHTSSTRPVWRRNFGGRRKGKRRWLALAFKLLAVLSLASALLYIPWSFDAVTYRLPRCLYWLAEGRWYWIGTIDGRLDYSSCGLEWQMIPLLLLAKTDRVLFLLSYLPFLLLPGLTYVGGRALGLARRPLLLWMWLVPASYCIVLQSSGLQNDGYTTSYTVACLAFAGVAIRRRDPVACLFAGLAASLLTGAKLSNLPLMLPLGVLMVVAAARSGFCKRPVVAGLVVMVLVSFLPLAVLSHLHTGSWTGDPTDQWGFRTGNPVAALLANLLLAGNDLCHPPVMVGTAAVNGAIQQLELIAAPLMEWLKQSHRMFHGVGLGDMVYEGGAGPGFSIGCFLLGGTLLGWFVRKSGRVTAPSWWQTAVIGCGIFAWLVLLSQLGSGQSARNASPYIPLLLFGFSRIRPFQAFLHSPAAPPLALFAMLSVVPIIILTPARPLLPLGLLEKCQTVGGLSGTIAGIVKKYELWQSLRDDLKPMREHLPPGEAVIGYAGAFRDTSYGLWKPLGSRTVCELGLPCQGSGCGATIPDYVVVTDEGIRQRYGQSLDEWMKHQRKAIRFTFERSTRLEADGAGGLHPWYLLGPAAAGVEATR